MFVEERHQEILRLLEENEKVKVKELSKRFEVTEDCIRKDLASMEAKNLLKRTYGGAVLPDTLHPGHTNIVSIRKDKNIKEKTLSFLEEISSSRKFSVFLFLRALTEQLLQQHLPERL